MNGFFVGAGPTVWQSRPDGGKGKLAETGHGEYCIGNMAVREVCGVSNALRLQSPIGAKAAAVKDC